MIQARRGRLLSSLLIPLFAVSALAFDRRASIDYADRYFGDEHSIGKKSNIEAGRSGYNTLAFTTRDNDCANFVSQTMIAGNWVFDRKLISSSDINFYFTHPSEVTTACNVSADPSPIMAHFEDHFGAIVAPGVPNSTRLSDPIEEPDGHIILGEPNPSGYNHWAHNRNRRGRDLTIFDANGQPTSVVPASTTSTAHQVAQLPDAPIVKYIRVDKTNDANPVYEWEYDADYDLSVTTGEYYRHTYNGLRPGTARRPRLTNIGSHTITVVFDQPMDVDPSKTFILLTQNISGNPWDVLLDNLSWFTTIHPNDSFRANFEIPERVRGDSVVITIEASSSDNPGVGSRIDGDGVLNRYRAGANEIHSFKVLGPRSPQAISASGSPVSSSLFYELPSLESETRTVRSDSSLIHAGRVHLTITLNGSAEIGTDDVFLTAPSGGRINPANASPNGDSSTWVLDFIIPTGAPNSGNYRASIYGRDELGRAIDGEPRTRARFDVGADTAIAWENSVNSDFSFPVDAVIQKPEMQRLRDCRSVPPPHHSQNFDITTGQMGPFSNGLQLEVKVSEFEPDTANFVSGLDELILFDSVALSVGNSPPLGTRYRFIAAPQGRNGLLDVSRYGRPRTMLLREILEGAPELFGLPGDGTLLARYQTAVANHSDTFFRQTMDIVRQVGPDSFIASLLKPEQGAFWFSIGSLGRMEDTPLTAIIRDRAGNEESQTVRLTYELDTMGPRLMRMVAKAGGVTKVVLEFVHDTTTLSPGDDTISLSGSLYKYTQRDTLALRPWSFRFEYDEPVVGLVSGSSRLHIGGGKSVQVSIFGDVMSASVTKTTLNTLPREVKAAMSGVTLALGAGASDAVCNGAFSGEIPLPIDLFPPRPLVTQGPGPIGGSAGMAEIPIQILDDQGGPVSNKVRFIEGRYRGSRTTHSPACGVNVSIPRTQGAFTLTPTEGNSGENFMMKVPVDQYHRTYTLSITLEDGAGNRKKYRFGEFYSFEWPGNPSFNMCDPTFINTAEGEPVAEIGDSAALSQPVAARISVPRPGNLVKASVPVYGFAGGANFERYELSYGAGVNPSSFTVIREETTPVTEDVIPAQLISGEPKIYGTIGNFEAGLTEYPDPIDPNMTDLGRRGEYTIRLRVFGRSGEEAVDSVVVRIGTVVGRNISSVAPSLDGRARFIAPAFALGTTWSEVYVEEKPLPAPLPSGFDSLGGAYRVLGVGNSFTPPATLELDAPEPGAVLLVWRGSGWMRESVETGSARTPIASVTPTTHWTFARKSGPGEFRELTVSQTARGEMRIRAYPEDPNDVVRVYLDDALQGDFLGGFTSEEPYVAIPGLLSTIPPPGAHTLRFATVSSGAEGASQSFPVEGGAAPSRIERFLGWFGELNGIPPFGGNLVGTDSQGIYLISDGDPGSLPRPLIDWEEPTGSLFAFAEDSTIEKVMVHVSSETADPAGFDLTVPLKGFFDYVEAGDQWYSTAIAVGPRSVPFLGIIGAAERDVIRYKVTLADGSIREISQGVSLTGGGPPAQEAAPYIRTTSPTHPTRYIAWAPQVRYDPTKAPGDRFQGVPDQLRPFGSSETTAFGTEDGWFFRGALQANLGEPLTVATHPILWMGGDLHGSSAGYGVFLVEGGEGRQIPVFSDTSVIPPDRSGFAPAGKFARMIGGGGLGSEPMSVLALLPEGEYRSLLVGEVEMTGFRTLDGGPSANHLRDLRAIRPGGSDAEFRFEDAASGAPRGGFTATVERMMAGSFAMTGEVVAQVSVDTADPRASFTGLADGLYMLRHVGDPGGYPFIIDRTPPRVVERTEGDISRLAPLRVVLRDETSFVSPPGIFPGSIRIDVNGTRIPALDSSVVYDQGTGEVLLHPDRGVLAGRFHDGEPVTVRISASDYAANAMPPAEWSVVYREATARISEVNMASSRGFWVEIHAMGPVDLGMLSLQFGVSRRENLSRYGDVVTDSYVVFASPESEDGTEFGFRTLSLLPAVRLASYGGMSLRASGIPQALDGVAWRPIEDTTATAPAPRVVGPTWEGLPKRWNREWGSLTRIDETKQNAEAWWVQPANPGRPSPDPTGQAGLFRLSEANLWGTDRWIEIEALQNASMIGLQLFDGSKLPRQLVSNGIVTLSAGDRVVVRWSQGVNEIDEIGDFDQDGIREIYIFGNPPSRSEGLIWLHSGEVGFGGLQWSVTNPGLPVVLQPFASEILPVPPAYFTDARVAGALTYGVRPDGSVGILAMPTPGEPNADAPGVGPGDILINEVAPYEPQKADWVELKAVTGPHDLRGFTLTDLDNLDLPFSELRTGPITLNAGDYIVVRNGRGVTEDDAIGDANGNGIREVYVEHLYLISTDEELVLFNGSTVIDVVRWSNQDGNRWRYWDADAREVEARGGWLGGTLQGAGVDLRTRVIARIPDGTDSDRKEDWGLVFPTPGARNVAAEDDTIPPTVSVEVLPSYDSAGLMYVGTQSAFTFQATDDNDIRPQLFISLNGEGFLLASTAAPLPMAGARSGPNRIEYFAEDYSGNRSETIALEFYKDVDAPVVHWGPVRGSGSNNQIGAGVQIRAVAKDSELPMDRITARLTEHFSPALVSSAEGRNDLLLATPRNAGETFNVSFRATDAVGNVTSGTVPIHLFHVPLPEFSLDTPPANEFQPGRPIEPIFTIDTGIDFVDLFSLDISSGGVRVPFEIRGIGSPASVDSSAVFTVANVVGDPWSLQILAMTSNPLDQVRILLDGAVFAEAAGGFDLGSTGLSGSLAAGQHTIDLVAISGRSGEEIGRRSFSFVMPSPNRIGDLSGSIPFSENSVYSLYDNVGATVQSVHPFGNYQALAVGDPPAAVFPVSLEDFLTVSGVSEDSGSGAPIRVHVSSERRDPIGIDVSLLKVGTDVFRRNLVLGSRSVPFLSVLGVDFQDTITARLVLADGTEREGTILIDLGQPPPAPLGGKIIGPIPAPFLGDLRLIPAPISTEQLGLGDIVVVRVEGKNFLGDGPPRQREPANPFEVSFLGLPPRTYFVDSENGDDANPGTFHSPWRTLDRAATGAGIGAPIGAGDTVFVREGNYDPMPTPTNEGTASERILFAAYPEEAPVIRTDEASFAIDLGARSFITVRGFAVEGFGGGISATGGEGLRIEANEVRGAENFEPLRLSGTIDATIESNVVLPFGGGDGSLVVFGSEGTRLMGNQYGPSLFMSGAQDAVVIGNEGGAMNIEGGSGSVVQDNRGGFLRADDVGSIRIERNRFTGAQLQIASAEPNAGWIAENRFDGAVNATGDWVFYRNLVVSAGSGIRYTATSIPVIVNNTIILSNGPVSGRVGLEILGVGGTLSQVKNNLVASLDSATSNIGVRTPSGINSRIFYHLVQGFGTNLVNVFTTTALGPSDGRPGFIAPDSDDFRIGVGSHAVNAGDPRDSVPPGGGSQIDIGAHEHIFRSNGGQTFYVDAASGDDANDGLSSESPLATIEEANYSILAGDTVILAQGTYQGPIRFLNRPTEDSPVRWIAAEGSEPVVAPGDGIIARTRAIEGLGVSNFVMKGITFRGAGSGAGAEMFPSFEFGIPVQSGSARFERCRFEDLSAGISPSDVQVLVEDCDFHRVGGALGSFNGDRSIEVTNSSFTDIGTLYSSEGGDLTAGRIEVDRAGAIAGGFAFSASFLDCRIFGIGFFSAGQGSGVSVRRSRIEGGRGFVVGEASMSIENSTIDFDHDALDAQDGATTWNNVSGRIGGRLNLNVGGRIRNSAFIFDTGAAGIVVQDTTRFSSFARNVVFGTSAAVFSENGAPAVTTPEEFLLTDPKFIDVSSGNFRPLASSPLLDAGDPAFATAEDIEGTLRPVGAQVDIGAYEFARADALRDLMLEPNPFSPNADGMNDTLTIFFRVTATDRGRYDRARARFLQDSEVVAVQEIVGPFSEGALGSIAWDGVRDSDGLFVADGRYRLSLDLVTDGVSAARETETDVFVGGLARSTDEIVEVRYPIEHTGTFVTSDATDTSAFRVAGNDVFFGPIYDLGPAGQTFSPPATLIFKFDDGVVSNETALDVFRYENGTWVPLAGTVNVESNCIVVLLDHLSEYTIGARDRSAPLVAINEPRAGATYVARRDSVAIDIGVADDLDPAPTIVSATLVFRDDPQIRRAVVNGDRIDPLDLRQGPWYLTVTVHDFVGNVVEATSGVFEVIHDIQPPRTTASVDAPAVGDFVTSATPVTLAVVDDLVEVGDGAGLGVALTEFALDGAAFQTGTSFSFAGSDGAHSALYRSTDIVGNRETDRNITLTLDNTAPEIASSFGAPQFTDTRALFVTSATPITFSITDAGVGVAGETTIITYLSGAGITSVTRNASDRLGNASQAVTVTAYVDDAAPVSDISVGSPSYGTYITSATPITITATDGAGAGVAAIVANGDTITGPVFLSGSGPVTLSHYAVDQLGNAETPRIRNFVLDNEPPTTTLVASPTDTTGAVWIRETLLSLAADDTGSGVASTVFRLDGGTFETYVSAFEIGTRITDTAPHTLGYLSTDRLGNADPERILTFRVSPALSVAKTRSLAPRVLVWWNYKSTEMPASQGAVEATIRSAGSLLLDTATTQDSFVAAMRTGRYNLFVIMGEEKSLNADEAKELAERVNLGAGAVTSLYDDLPGPWLDHDMRGGEEAQALDNVLGVKAAGAFDDPTIQVLFGDLSDTGFEIATTGRSDRVKVSIGETLALVTGDSSAAATLRRYGSGDAVFFAWDLAKNWSDTTAGLLNRAVDAATPETEPRIAGGVTAVRITVRSLVIPLDLSVAIDELIPTDVNVVSVTPPALVSGGALTWTVLLDAGEETQVSYTVEAPADTATTEATVRYLVRGTYRTFGTFPLALAGTTAPADLESVRTILIGVRDQVDNHAGDRTRVEKTLATVEGLLSRPPATNLDREEATKNLLDGISEILRVENPAVRADILRAREIMDRVVVHYGIEGLPQ